VVVLVIRVRYEPLANGVLRLGLGAHAACGSADNARATGPELGVDLVVDAVGAEATRQMAIDLVRPGGRVVCIGLASDEEGPATFAQLVQGPPDEVKLLLAGSGRAASDGPC
jgi:threonine dehydrogenase-like Zn-dependent dehydrogenase